MDLAFICDIKWPDDPRLDLKGSRHIHFNTWSTFSACMKTWRHWNHTKRQIVSHILYNTLIAHFKINEIAGQIDINRMNWTTKAKTRAGRGRSKADIENQQRLTARNKLPKGKSTSEAVRALTADKASSLFRPFSDRSSELSNDLMMLQSSTDSFVSQKLRPSQSQPQLSRRPPKAVNINDMEDPLLLLEYTVISYCYIFITHQVWNHKQQSKVTIPHSFNQPEKDRGDLSNLQGHTFKRKLDHLDGADDSQVICKHSTNILPVHLNIS